jgi:hypothetical protein
MTDKPPIAPLRRNKRAIILPGGGMRVAYQAGALQRLHEDGLRYSFGDGTSGGIMNLGALLSGVQPADLARRWRRLNPTNFVSPLSLRNYLSFPNIKSFGDFDGVREKVFPHLGIEPDKIRRSTGVTAQFNVCNFRRKAVVAIPHTEITQGLMLAGMSLPMFTPAIQENNETWTDAVWIQDSNLAKSVAAGANELWVIWCIGNTPAWLPGTLNQYVHMIEMSAIAGLNAELAAVARLNEQIAAGMTPFGHTTPIKVHLIRPDLPIPLDPDYVAGKVSGDALVDQGYMDAARYLAQKSAGGSVIDQTLTQTQAPKNGISFRETMTGRISFDTTDPIKGGADRNAIPVVLKATINLRDIHGFVRDQQHRGDMAAHLYSPRLGGIRPATHSNFQLFAPTDDPNLTHMTYELGVLLDGKPYWFSGRKHVRRSAPWNMWRETTTLYVTLHEGIDRSGNIVAAGVLRLGIIDFLGLMTTLTPRDCIGLSAKFGAILRFVDFFGGALLRTYFWRGRRS